MKANFVFPIKLWKEIPNPNLKIQRKTKIQNPKLGSIGILDFLSSI